MEFFSYPTEKICKLCLHMRPVVFCYLLKQKVLNTLLWILLLSSDIDFVGELKVGEQRWKDGSGQDALHAWEA